MKFYANIPDTRRAFEIPGSKSEARLLLVMAEDMVPRCLPLILRRGELFMMSFQVLEEIPLDKQRQGRSRYKKTGLAIETLAAISSRDAAIRIGGSDGMSIYFAIPSLNEKTLVKLLSLREKLLEVTIQEKGSV
jgi:hypothetical protein